MIKGNVENAGLYRGPSEGATILNISRVNNEISVTKATASDEDNIEHQISGRELLFEDNSVRNERQDMFSF